MSCFQKMVLRLLTVACIVGWGSSLLAQDPAPPPGTPPATAVPPTVAPQPGATTSLSPTTFPPLPGGIFYRGNRNSLGPLMPPVAGGYISLFKFVPVLLLFFAWVHYGNWVGEDS